MYRGWAKRAMDVLVACAGLLVCAPLMLVLSILIRMNMGRPILFRQRRPGFEGRPFTCLKFRTMSDARDKNGELLSDQQRMGPLGLWMRRTSLDELPQMWNVIRGELSFIGPRPLLIEYLPYYTVEEHRRHSVRPGLTGWAQIHGRNHVNFDERLKMDLWYVDHLSWHVDLRILLSTVRVVFSAKGTDLVSYPPLHEQRRVAMQLQNVVSTATTESESSVQEHAA